METKERSSKTVTAIAQQDLSDDPELPDRVLRPQRYTIIC
jgi:hypothetical protein